MPGELSASLCYAAGGWLGYVEQATQWRPGGPSRKQRGGDGLLRIELLVCNVRAYCPHGGGHCRSTARATQAAQHQHTHAERRDMMSREFFCCRWLPSSSRSKTLAVLSACCGTVAERPLVIWCVSTYKPYVRVVVPVHAWVGGVLAVHLTPVATQQALRRGSKGVP